MGLHAGTTAESKLTTADGQKQNTKTRGRTAAGNAKKLENTIYMNLGTQSLCEVTYRSRSEACDWRRDAATSLSLPRAVTSLWRAELYE